MKTISNNKLLIFIFLAGAILRLVLIAFGNNPDILSIAGWGKWIHDHGANGFYENNIWTYSGPTQAPLFNLLIAWTYLGYDQTLNFLRWLTFNIVPHLAPGHMRWWFDWVWWWERTLFSPTNFLYGFIMWIKIPPIIADLFLAMIIYLIGKRNISHKKSLLITGLFLFLPFSWYISSLWGQYDQLVALFEVLCFLALYKRQFFISAFFLLIAGQIKATAAFFVPFYIFYFFYQKPSMKDILLTGLISVGAFWLMTQPFTNKNPFLYTYEVIYPKVLSQERWTAANHVFNFWQFLYPQKESATANLLGIQVFLWSLIFLAIIYFWSFNIIHRENNLKNLLISLYLVSAGSYFFSTGMVDRYFFPTIVFFALLIFFYPRLFILWILTSLLYLFSLFYSWGFPFLTIEQVWKNDLIIGIFSLIQPILFFISLKIIGLVNYELPK